jgi:rhamnopyranosyl-N-acetylglucosaminyl-diphospho-decaprenol beta-1,3/1,4-galactofuranosyltransferase
LTVAAGQGLEGPVAHRGRVRTPLVTAVVVTRNRCDRVLQCTEGLQRAHVAPARVVVVDNASQDDTAAVVTRLQPAVELYRSARNLGPAGGFAVGMAAALTAPCQWVMVLNDDCLVETDTLRRLLEVAAEVDRQVAVVAPAVRHGGRVVAGYRWRHVAVPVRWAEADAHPAVVDVDLVTFNGALIRAEAVAAVGVPRADFFMMWEEWEYCLRLRRAGYRIVVAPGVQVEHLTLGSDGRSAPWRGYYQARNHLRWALEQRSVVDVGWWAVLQARLAAAAILWGDRKLARVWWRIRGAADALAGRMGPAGGAP